MAGRQSVLSVTWSFILGFCRQRDFRDFVNPYTKHVIVTVLRCVAGGEQPAGAVPWRTQPEQPAAEQAAVLAGALQPALTTRARHHAITDLTPPTLHIFFDIPTRLYPMCCRATTNPGIGLAFCIFITRSYSSYKSVFLSSEISCTFCWHRERQCYMLGVIFLIGDVYDYSFKEILFSCTFSFTILVKIM